MEFSTADLFDAHEGQVQVLTAGFRDYGGVVAFCGPISTIKALEDNSRVREAVTESGEGRVLVIDGAGSRTRAMLGDMLAAKAVDNGWSGVLINGCLRDTLVIAGLALGVKALGSTPAKTQKLGQGLRDVPVQFAAVQFCPGQWLYGDADGVLVSDERLI